MRKAMLMLLLICVVCGCGKKNPTLEPVNTFSVGNAQVPTLTDKPTAEELYTAVLQFYDSFDTVSASCELAVRTIGDAKVEDDSASGVKAGTTTRRVEYRYKKPNRELTIIDNMFTSVPSGDEKRKHPVAAWLRLDPRIDPGSARTIDHMTLLNNSTVNGDQVYVLELRLPSQKLKQNFYSPEVRRFFIGKTDLLPRKIEVIQEHKMPVKALACESATTRFSGMMVNEPVPDGIFTLQRY